jgi:hypothetical protein
MALESLTFAAIQYQYQYQDLIQTGDLPKDDIPLLFATYSVGGRMELKSFISILSYLSDTPTTSVIETTEEEEVDIEEVQETTQIKSKSDLIDTKNEENPYTDSDLDSIEEEEEISVERAFSELAGRRKTVTFESLVGWDIVAELLQDGALNTDVRAIIQCAYSITTAYCILNQLNLRNRYSFS